MSALLDSLATAFDGDATRRQLLDAALRDGLPGARSEAWKYTSLRALERRTFSTPGDLPIGIETATLADIPTPRMVFVNGRFTAAHSDMAALAAGVTLAHGAAAADDAHSLHSAASAEVFARLNAALAGDGVSLRVAAGVAVGAPLHLVFIGAPAGTDLAWHLRHRIALGDGASLTLVEHHLATGDNRHLDTAALRIDLAPASTLLHARVQAANDGTTSFLRTDASLDSDARYQRIDLELGNALSRHELNVRLHGDRAQLIANGVLLAAGRRHVDTRLGIEHVARDTSCALLWRGIGAERGRVVFHGGITIHAGADGSDALLSSKNLLLGNDAEIDTQPVLIINADEVKAAHGATVGQLDPTAMFYLRSRGLPEDAARRLLTTAFVREPLGVIASTALRDLLQAHVDRALERLAAT
ncbi:MAG: Fe-S cluster assembly protein SufD [Luteimonas sp.]